MSSNIGISLNQSIDGDAIPKLYAELATDGFQPLLATLAGGKALIGLIGILLNLDLVYITKITPNFDGICNFLIAVDALCVAIYQLSFLLSFLVLASGVNLVPFPVCFYAQLIPSFMKYFACGLMVAIGLDRLKSVLFVSKNLTSKRRNRIFQIVWLLSFGLPPAYLMWLSHGSMRQGNIMDKMVMCSTSEISQGISSSIAFGYALLLNIVSPIIYCLLGVILFLKKKAAAASINGQSPQHWEKTGKIFKSIFVIMIVQLLGWSSNAIFMMLFGRDYDGLYSSKWVMAWTILGTYLLALATAANAPILYFCSGEYRRAFNEHLGQIFLAISNPTEGVGTSNNLRNSSSRMRSIRVHDANMANEEIQIQT